MYYFSIFPYGRKSKSCLYCQQCSSLCPTYHCCWILFLKFEPFSGGFIHAEIKNYFMKFSLWKDQQVFCSQFCITWLKGLDLLMHNWKSMLWNISLNLIVSYTIQWGNSSRYISTYNVIYTLCMMRVNMYINVWHDVWCVVRPGWEIKIGSCCIAMPAICIQKLVLPKIFVCRTQNNVFCLHCNACNLYPKISISISI